MSGKPLKIPDSKVFNETPEFRVSQNDLKKAQIHTGIKKIQQALACCISRDPGA